MTVGGLNPRLFDPTSVVRRRNINKFGFWGVEVDAVTVGTKDMQWSNRSIVLDTGTVGGIPRSSDRSKFTFFFGHAVINHRS